VFDRVPVLGDDVSRFLWPEWVGRRPPNPEQEKNAAMTPMMNWLKANTPADAKIVGPRQIRMGALRPIVHEWGGAVMLIEGDPAAFIEAYRRERQLRSPEYQNPAEKSKLFVSWGADYWVTNRFIPELPLAYSDSGWFVYDLRNSFVR
jgi:hypothetical protein